MGRISTQRLPQRLIYTPFNPPDQFTLYIQQTVYNKVYTASFTLCYPTTNPHLSGCHLGTHCRVQYCFMEVHDGIFPQCMLVYIVVQCAYTLYNVFKSSNFQSFFLQFTAHCTTGHNTMVCCIFQFKLYSTENYIVKRKLQRIQ